MKGQFLDNKAFIFAPLAEGNKRTSALIKMTRLTQHKQEGNCGRDSSESVNIFIVSGCTIYCTKAIAQ